LSEGCGEECRSGEEGGECLEQRVKGGSEAVVEGAKVVGVDGTGTVAEGRPVLAELEVASGLGRGEELAKVA
ncbi:hypothetical protein ACSRAT_24760, partial [Salmonella enterica]|uniref:hypothetical protein n=1 Tax=Salmonella enterica TaxID=28901 RepID=UPI003EDB72B9